MFNLLIVPPVNDSIINSIFVLPKSSEEGIMSRFLTSVFMI